MGKNYGSLVGSPSNRIGADPAFQTPPTSASQDVTVDTIAALKLIDPNGYAGKAVRVLGTSVKGDGGGASYVWDAASTSPANDDSVVAWPANPTPATGRWLIVPERAASVPDLSLTPTKIADGQEAGFRAKFDTPSNADLAAVDERALEAELALNAAKAAKDFSNVVPSVGRSALNLGALATKSKASLGDFGDDALAAMRGNYLIVKAWDPTSEAWPVDTTGDMGAYTANKSAWTISTTHEWNAVEYQATGLLVWNGGTVGDATDWDVVGASPSVIPDGSFNAELKFDDESKARLNVIQQVVNDIVAILYLDPEKWIGPAIHQDGRMSLTNGDYIDDEVSKTKVMLDKLVQAYLDRSNLTHIFVNAQNQIVGDIDANGETSLSPRGLYGSLAAAFDRDMALRLGAPDYETSILVVTDDCTSTTPGTLRSEAFSLRIPSSTQYPDAHGNIYLFYEARLASAEDHSPKRLEMIILNAVTGAASGPFVVFDPFKNGIRQAVVNPQPVLDPNTGRVWVRFSIFQSSHDWGSHTGDDWDHSTHGEAFFAIYSDNPSDGASAVWKGADGEPITDEIESLINLTPLYDDITGYPFTSSGGYPSPAAGIYRHSDGKLAWVDQLGDGYLVVCFYDPTGEVWSHGPLIRNTPENNESAIVELSDGYMLISSRDQNTAGSRIQIVVDPTGNRVMGYSRTDIHDARCQGSLLRWGNINDGGANRLIFANLDHNTTLTSGARFYLGLRRSYDDGKTWTPSKQVFTGEKSMTVDVDAWGTALSSPYEWSRHTGYSALAQRDGERGWCIFEHNPVWRTRSAPVYRALAITSFTLGTLAKP